MTNEICSGLIEVYGFLTLNPQTQILQSGRGCREREKNHNHNLIGKKSAAVDIISIID